MTEAPFNPDDINIDHSMIHVDGPIEEGLVKIAPEFTISEFLIDSTKALEFCKTWRENMGTFLADSGFHSTLDYQAHPQEDAMFIDMASFAQILGLPLALWSSGDHTKTLQHNASNSGGHWNLLLKMPELNDTQVFVYDPMRGEQWLPLENGRTFGELRQSHLHLNATAATQIQGGTYNLEIPEVDNYVLKSWREANQDKKDYYNCGPMCLFSLLLRATARELLSDENKQEIFKRFKLKLPSHEQLPTELGIEPLF